MIQIVHSSCSLDSRTRDVTGPALRFQICDAPVTFCWVGQLAVLSCACAGRLGELHIAALGGPAAARPGAASRWRDRCAVAVVGSGRIARRRSVPVFLLVIAVGAGVCSIVISMPPRLATSLGPVAAAADAAAATMRAEALPGELRRTGVSLVEVLDEALRCRSDGVSRTVVGFVDKASSNVSCRWVAAATAVIVISSACCAVHCVAVSASLPR
eukprot:COSAG01_NODE_26_length_36857_cov_31.426166_11_plen_214_part_00